MGVIASDQDLALCRKRVSQYAVDTIPYRYLRANQRGPSRMHTLRTLGRRFDNSLHRASIPSAAQFLLTTRPYSKHRHTVEKRVNGYFWKWLSKKPTPPESELPSRDDLPKDEQKTTLRSIFRLLLKKLSLPMLIEKPRIASNSRDTGSSGDVEVPDDLTLPRFVPIVRETMESMTMAMEEVCLEVKELNPDNKEDAISQRYVKRADALAAEIHAKHGLTREVLSAAMIKYQQEPAFLVAMTELQQEQAERFANAASIFNGDLKEDFFTTRPQRK